jgi:site-specific DNA recombinase
MTQRAALYARVSTAQQEQEQTVASQVAALEAAAETLGCVIPIDRRYVDDGCSGSRLDRPGLDALRDAAAEGVIDVVLIYCPDRLARNYVHQHVLIEEFDKRGVRVHFVERPVSERAEDRLLVQRQGVIAEYERAKIVERTRRGKQHKLRQGQLLPYGAEAPYGYGIVRAGDGPRRIVIDESEATHVRAMYRWVLDDGMSARGVAKRLNAEGVVPRRAKLWTQGTIFNVLTNPAYIGLATYNRREPSEPKRPRHPGVYRRQVKSSSRWRPRAEWLSVPIPAIVEPEVQSAVRSAVAKHKVWSPRNVQYEHLLRGLVVCGDCGWRMECAHQARRTQRFEYFYYACRHHDPVETGRPERCTARRVRQAALDAVVWDALVAWIQSPQMLVEEVAAWRASQAGAAHLARDLARLESAQHQIATQIARLIDAYQHGALSVEELRERRERLEMTGAAARARAEELAAQTQDHARLERLGEDLALFAATLRTGLDTLDFAGRQRLVRLLVERVVVTGDQVAIEHAIPLAGRFAGLRQQRGRAGVPQVRRADGRTSDDRGPGGDPSHPDAPRAVARRWRAGSRATRGRRLVGVAIRAPRPGASRNMGLTPRRPRSAAVALQLRGAPPLGGPVPPGEALCAPRSWGGRGRGWSNVPEEAFGHPFPGLSLLRAPQLHRSSGRARSPGPQLP